VSAAALDAGLVDLDWRGRSLRLECEWVGAPRERADGVVVFLHEGLGSVSMWRDFPRAFCDRYGFAGFVFSRYGYGRSTPRPHDERWAPDFMARQADEVLPALFASVGIEAPWLLGHSDGATIALLHAARRPARGVVAVAPHLFVEDVSIASIAKAREAYETTDLRRRLARYHDDVDSAFRGWNDVWLSPEFRSWNIESEIATIRCPLLAVQGENDEYGTLEQIRAVARNVPQAELLVLPACGHSPHRDQAEALMHETGRFIAGV
jgi:pimeloyl-ACP methyl ester carboxylesterase